MLLLIIPLMLFFIAFAVHGLVWRIKTPVSQQRALAYVFFGTWLTGVICLIYVFPSHLLTPFKITYISFAYFSFSLAYFVVYPAIEVDSPSLMIIKAIAQAKQEGVSKEEIFRLFPDNFFITPRVDDLHKAKLIVKKKEIYQISSKGKAFISLFIVYRRLLNKSTKGG